MINGVPNYAAPHEIGLYLAVETERSFNEMMQNIGIEELHSFEENGKVVLEADAAEAAKEKKANVIVKWIKDRWEDLKKLIDKALESVKNLIVSAKKKIASLLGSADNKKIVVNAVERLKGTDKNGKKKLFGKDYMWTGFDDVCSGKSIINVAVKAYNDFAVRAADGKLNYKEEKDELEKKIGSYLGIKGDVTTSAIKDSITTTMRGSEIDIDKEYLKSNIDQIFKSATEYNEEAAKLTKFLSTTKKAFADAEKTVKSAARKDKGDENLAGAASIIKAEAVFFTAASSAITVNLRSRVSNSIRIILRLAIAAKQKEEKEKKAEEVKQESAIVPSSFQTELASLFEF